jgi:hypothetical protein
MNCSRNLCRYYLNEILPLWDNHAVCDHVKHNRCGLPSACTHRIGSAASGAAIEARSWPCKRLARSGRPNGTRDSCVWLGPNLTKSLWQLIRLTSQKKKKRSIIFSNTHLKRHYSRWVLGKDKCWCCWSDRATSAPYRRTDGEPGLEPA